MKYALLSFLFVSSAFAGSYRPNRMTCQQLNDLLQERGRISVVYGLLGLSRGSMWLNEEDADRNCSVVEQPEWNSLDGKCIAGFMCELNPSVD